MNRHLWSTDMRLGVECIDSFHESFLRELEALTDTGDGVFCEAFPRLVAKLEKDFLEEEVLMEEIDYPGLCCHREQHARILGALHQVAGHVLRGEVELGRRAVQLLPQWFEVHLATMDTALAFAIELNQAESEAALGERTTEPR